MTVVWNVEVLWLFNVHFLVHIDQCSWCMGEAPDQLAWLKVHNMSSSKVADFGYHWWCKKWKSKKDTCLFTWLQLYVGCFSSDLCEGEECKVTKWEDVQSGTVSWVLIKWFRWHIPMCPWYTSEGPSQLAWVKVDNTSISKVTDLSHQRWCEQYIPGR